MKYLGILPKPHPLGMDISTITSPDMLPHSDEKTCYPDAVAVSYDNTNGKVAAVYSDRSLFMWDIRDMSKIGKYRSFIYHSDCVWGVEVSVAARGIDDLNACSHTFSPHTAVSDNERFAELYQ